MTIQVNLRSTVNSAKIRREEYNGQEHIVVPSYTLPADVIMNGGLYPASEIDKHYQGLEGTLAPVGHPTLDGEFISARSPEGINQAHAGAWNRNVRKVGNRVYVEKWVNVEFAKNSEKGRELLERLEALEAGTDVEPIHTSVALFLERDPVEGKDYEWVARINEIDHDAILLHEVGGATPEQGVGLMVNVEQATPMPNGVMGESYQTRYAALNNAARELLGTDAWVVDFTDADVIIDTNGTTHLHGYTYTDGIATIRAEAEQVERKESWIKRNPIVNMLRKFFTTNQARPDTTEEEPAMGLTPEEKAELLEGVGKAVANQMQPIDERLSALEANQEAIAKQLAQAEDEKEKAMRDAVAKEHGEVVANSLKGEALAALYQKIGTSENITANSAVEPEEPSVPSMSNYFNEGK